MSGRPLNETTLKIKTKMKKIEEEMRILLQRYQDRKSTASAAERRRGGNLMVTDLAEKIASAGDAITFSDFTNTEYLQTCLVIVPKNYRADWEASYHTLDGESVPVGPPEDRERERTSPVVPGSSRLLLEDREGFGLYNVTVLRKFFDSFVADAQSKRFSVREFTYDPEALTEAGLGEAKEGNALTESEKALCTWCAGQYEVACKAWLHVKALRCFVESVLRYGLPVDFSAFLLKPRKKYLSSLRKTLGKLFGHLGDGLGDGGDDGAKDTRGDLGGDFYPYVSLDL